MQRSVFAHLGYATAGARFPQSMLRGPAVLLV